MVQAVDVWILLQALGEVQVRGGAHLEDVVAEDVVAEERLPLATPKCGMCCFQSCIQLLNVLTNYTFHL